MEKIKLSKIAQIDISGVDKKTKAGEKEVLLCNFTDVYYNWAITDDTTKDFMKASANNNQIEKFTIHKGDVAITKDSETRDDIGVATYIATDIEGIVLGYHCAIIRPNENVLLGSYLNVVLHSKYAQKYFEYNASGSGQRYTLTTDIIGDFPVPVPDIEYQKKIGELFSLIDRKIEINNLESKKQNDLMKELYNYWFVQFDFPDSDGKPYKSSGGTLVYDEELKTEIPEGWVKRSLSDISDMRCESVNPEMNVKYNHYSIPAFDDSIVPDIEDGVDIASSKYVVPDKSVLVSKLNPHFKRLWSVTKVLTNGICSTEFIPICSNRNEEGYLFYLLDSEAAYEYMVNRSSSSTGSRKRIQPEVLMQFSFSYPDNDDLCKKFSEMASDVIRLIEIKRNENETLRRYRDYLIPIIMDFESPCNSL